MRRTSGDSMAITWIINVLIFCRHQASPVCNFGLLRTVPKHLRVLFAHWIYTAGTVPGWPRTVQNCSDGQVRKAGGKTGRTKNCCSFFARKHFWRPCITTLSCQLHLIKAHSVTGSNVRSVTCDQHFNHKIFFFDCGYTGRKIVCPQSAACLNWNLQFEGAVRARCIILFRRRKINDTPARGEQVMVSLGRIFMPFFAS